VDSYTTIDGHFGGPTEHPERLYLWDEAFIVYALEPGTGATSWRTDTGIAIFNSVMFGDEFYIIAGSEYNTLGSGAVLALSQRDGTHLWRQDTPVLATASGAAGHLIVGDGEGAVHALDPATGRRVWHTPAPPNTVISFGGIQDLVPMGHTVYSILQLDVPRGYNHLLQALDPVTGGVRWTVDPNDAIAEEPLAEGSAIMWFSAEVDGMVHLLRHPAIADWQMSSASPTDNLAALDVRTGETVWRYNAHSINPPLLAGGSIYVYSLIREGGPFQVCALDARSGRPRWTVQLDREEVQLIAGPGEADGDLLLTEFGVDERTLCLLGGYGLLSLDTNTGARKWSAYIDDSQTAPVLARGYVYIGRHDHARVGRWQADTGRKLRDIEVVGTQTHGLLPASNVMYVMTNTALYAIPWQTLTEPS
jgi:outer membrane protein assembly factor BamB